MNYSNRLNKNNNDIRLAIEKANNLPNASSGATWIRTVECEGELPEFSDWCTDKVYLNTYLSMDETNEILQSIADAMGGSDITIAYAENPNNPDADGVWYLSLYVDREDDLMILYESYDNIYYANRQIREDEKGYRPFDPDFIGWNSSIDLIDFGQVAPIMIDNYEVKKLFSFKPYSNAYDGYWPTAEKLYINKNKTLEEVEKLVKNIVESGLYTAAYWYYLNKYEELYFNSDSNGEGYYIGCGRQIQDEDGNWYSTQELLFTTFAFPEDDDYYEFTDFVGWNPNINEIIIPDEVVFYANPIIKDLFSSKPYSETVEYIIEGEYIGGPYYANSTVDMLTLIENKQIPSVITVPKEYVIEVDELPAENIDTNKLYKLPDNTPDKWVGAGIPKEGYVDTVYFNLNITADQIAEIVDNIPSSSFNIMSNGNDKYLNFRYSDYSDGPYIWMEWRNWSNASFNFSGGNVSLSSSYPSFKFDSELVWVDEWGGPIDPSIIDIFKDLVSATPFVKVEKPLTAGTYYKYDGQIWSELLNTVSVEELPKNGKEGTIYNLVEVCPETGWSGTAVPHNWPGGDMYLNPNLTAKEAQQIVQSLYNALGTENTNFHYNITPNGSTYLYGYTDDNYKVTSFNLYAWYSQVCSYSYGDYWTSSSEQYYVGSDSNTPSGTDCLYNDLIKNIISATPIEWGVKGGIKSLGFYQYVNNEWITFAANNFIKVDEFPANPLPDKVYEYKKTTSESWDWGEFRDIYIKFPEEWEDENFSSLFNNLVTLREYLHSKGDNRVQLYYLYVNELPELDENNQYIFTETITNEKVIISEVDSSDERIVILVGENEDPYMLKNMEWIPMSEYLTNLTGYNMEYQSSVRDIYSIGSMGYYKMYYTGDRPIAWRWGRSYGNPYGGVLAGNTYYNSSTTWSNHICCNDYVITSAGYSVDENGWTYYEDSQTSRRYYANEYWWSSYYEFFIYDGARDTLMKARGGSVNDEWCSTIPGQIDYMKYNGGNGQGIFWRNVWGQRIDHNLLVTRLEKDTSYTYYDIYTEDNGYWTKWQPVPSSEYTIYSNGTYNVKDYGTVYVQTNAPDPGSVYNINSNGSYDINSYERVNVKVGDKQSFKISFDSQQEPTDYETLWIPLNDTVSNIEFNRGDLDTLTFDYTVMADTTGSPCYNDFIEWNDKIYEIGKSYIWIYDTITGEEQTIETSSCGDNSRPVIVGDYLYAIGGSGSGGFPASHIRKINLLDSTVTSTTGNIPTHNGGAVAYKDGYIYIFGCKYSSTNRNRSTKIYKYDVANETYTQLSTTFADYFDWGQCFVMNDKIYIVGGYNSQNVFVFDPSDESLEEIFEFEFTSRVRSAVLYKESILITCDDEKIYCYDYKNNTLGPTYEYSLSTYNIFVVVNGVLYLARGYKTNSASLYKLEEYKTTKMNRGDIKIVDGEDGIPYTVQTLSSDVKIPLKIGCILMGQGSSKPAAKAKFKIHNGTEWVEY